MKHVFTCLLIAALLFSLAMVVGADSAGDPGETSEDSVKIVFVPSEEDLPEGYVVDEDFVGRITLGVGNEDGNWYASLMEFLASAEDDEYIYFIVEENIPVNYTAYYAMDSVGTTGGNVIIVRNVKEPDAPVYELPETGGSGMTIYTVIGVGILLNVAAYYMLLRYKRKHNV